MTLILSGTDGVSDVDGSAATPAVRGTDTNTGIFFPAADTIGFSEGGVEVARITNTAAWSFGASGTNTGTSGQVLTSAGSGAAPTWATPAGGSLLRVTRFTEEGSGTWTRGAGTTSVLIMAIGAGGAGASTGGSSSGGGGGGGYAELFVAAAPATYAYVVGAGGVGTAGGAGSNGGNTTIAGITATGGRGTGSNTGGVGGEPTGGSINIFGGPGMNGGTTAASRQGGYGAGAAGGPGGGGITGAAFLSGSNFGGGGGGSGGAGPGGDGAKGYIEIQEYA